MFWGLFCPVMSSLVKGLAGPVMGLCGARDEITPDNEKTAALLLLVIFTDPFKDYTNSQVS